MNMIQYPHYFRLVLPIVLIGFASFVAAAEPIASDKLVFAEQDGFVAIEAEHYFQQSRSDKRAFYLTDGNQVPKVTPDGDPSHAADASGGAYLEVLPDTRRTHSDKLTKGVNFAPEAGTMAVLDYHVNFATPGRYYVWVRAHSTGPEDNGLHVGLDDSWPESGQRMQWCEGKNRWRWESKQRTEQVHCGEPHLIFLDIAAAGEHVVHFSMREDGFEFDKFILTTNRDFAPPEGAGPDATVKSGTLQEIRQPSGDGSVTVAGELKAWHKITLNLNGPFAHENDRMPNPFTDYRMSVRFTHDDGSVYNVPGYFAADGEASNTSAQSGTVWRTHFAPDKTGEWKYTLSFHQGELAALDATTSSEPLAPYDGQSGSFTVDKSDKQGRDLRAHGRLQYVGKHYLQFAGSGEYFMKAGADAPETLLAYKEFDNTIAGNPKKAPLKSWSPHVGDWRDGDPSWGDGKGKGLIGAINYLSAKGCNAFSFLTYNAGGDGDNVWPFTDRDDKLHYDCSKLDQWAAVFEHGTHRGMYLHFKMQETENDDNRGGGKRAGIPESLDGGDLGTQRKLYCRELIARFGHNLALNWNLGEENTQSTDQQQAMINYIADTDPYNHPIVIHTFPNEQDKVYQPLLGDKSRLTGLSLQNSSLETTHEQTVKWVEASDRAGKPWVVAFDESGSAAHAQCPDLGYKGFDGHDRQGKMIYDQHQVRKQTLWGTLMAGGAGCEYYFGYQFDENDIVCEDWRSRDKSWDYCRIALEFFRDQRIAYWEMKNADALVGNPEHRVGKFCFASSNETYLVYLPDGGTSELDLSSAQGAFTVRWYNPRSGGELATGSAKLVHGGGSVSLGTAPSDELEDWLVVVRRAS